MFSASDSTKQLFGSKRPSPLDVTRGGRKTDLPTSKGDIHNRPSKGECRDECSAMGDRMIK